MNNVIIFVYDNVTVSQKGLRNENSIEMMEIINGSRGVEFSQVTGITSALHQGLNGVFDLPRIPGETYAVDTVVYIQPDKRVGKRAGFHRPVPKPSLPRGRCDHEVP